MSLDELIIAIREKRAAASERHENARLIHVRTKMYTLGQIRAYDEISQQLAEIVSSDECGRHECKERLEALRQIWRLLEELEL
jgi:hypothetical protein